MLKRISIVVPVIFGLIYSATISAQNKVVVVPLGESAVPVTTIALPRIDVQCLADEIIYSPSQNLTDFVIDDRKVDQPKLVAFTDIANLPQGTSAISVFTAAFEQDLQDGNGLQQLLAAGIYTGSSPGSYTQFSLAVFSCSDSTTTSPVLALGADTMIETEVIYVTSMSGKSWAIRSNFNLRDGVITLGPTVLTQENSPAPKRGETTNHSKPLNLDLKGNPFVVPSGK